MSAIMCFSFLSAMADSGQVIPDYSQKERSGVPAEFTWNIGDLYPSHEAWMGERDQLKSLIGKMDERIQNWTASAASMLELFSLVDEAGLMASKMYVYAGFQSDTDMADTRYQAMKGEIQALAVDMSARLSSMDSDILALGGEKFASFLKSEPKLETYRFRVENTLRQKEHILSGDKEKIVSLTGLFTDAPDRAAGMLNNVEIPPASVQLPDGRTVSLDTAAYMAMRGDADPEVRSRVMHAFWNNQKGFANTLAILLDAVVKQHLFTARVRDYSDCLQARLAPENIDPSVYHQLIASMRENLAPLHRYLGLKKRLLGLPVYRYDDIYASAVKSVSRKFTFDEAEKLVIDSLMPLGEEYARILRQAFDERWIDVYPNKGKQSGAYSNGVYGVHPYVKLNYNGNYDSVSTLAHELGHALHSYLADHKQPFALSQYSLFLAEIASTFNENLLMQHLLKSEKDDAFKLYILDGYLDQVRATLYRQTLFAEFELDMHRRTEAGQTLTADELSKKYLELTRYYYGHEQKVMEVGDYIQYEWNWIPHFFYNFYVFQYSTGIIASLALSDKVLTGDPVARDVYLQMLSSGGSDYPLELLKKAGIDMTTPAPYEAALKRFDQLTGEMEKLVDRLEKKKK